MSVFFLIVPLRFLLQRSVLSSSLPPPEKKKLIPNYYAMHPFSKILEIVKQCTQINHGILWF